MARPDFGAFYEASFRRVVTATRAFCGDREIAYEATQEAFARAYARWARVGRAASPEAWVITTASNLCRRSFRRRGAGATSREPTSAPPTGDRVDLLVALQALPDRQRQAVVLHYIADCSVQNVADAMGISDGAVKAHLFKAREALRRSMEVRHA